MQKIVWGFSEKGVTHVGVFSGKYDEFDFWIAEQVLQKTGGRDND